MKVALIITILFYLSYAQSNREPVLMTEICLYPPPPFFPYYKISTEYLFLTTQPIPFQNMGFGCTILGGTNCLHFSQLYTCYSSQLSMPLTTRMCQMVPVFEWQLYIYNSTTVFGYFAWLPYSQSQLISCSQNTAPAYFSHFNNSIPLIFGWTTFPNNNTILGLMGNFSNGQLVTYPVVSTSANFTLVDCCVGPFYSIKKNLPFFQPYKFLENAKEITDITEQTSLELRSEDDHRMDEENTVTDSG